ncbi:MAG: aminotransferase class I/II-fold pyridoxal phosphate-dependent enzyme [Lachnospiraceae bacterium]|nr:aminotransferase class I/II-fold pyridoxal phosphate-dependent enzyme [Lachnospiraceae bacterium]
MLHFDSDYMEGAHPRILKKLMETNMEQTSGYGTDTYTLEAKQRIRQACNCPEAEVYLLVGGTQTNSTVIDGVLTNYEGVLAAQTGHISVHEAGAVEHSGHKVLTLPQKQGKLDAREVRSYLQRFYQDENQEHMVYPGMVYISHPTEYGTLYTKAELEELYQVCQEYQIPLFLDGARLGYGLMAEGTDVTLEEIAALTDVFYIGGTKVGALFGEAVVFTNPKLAKHFFTIVKQHGALFAKGRILGIQFAELFTDDLYLRISRHAIDMAGQLIRVFERHDFQFYLKTPTNQQFLILEKKQMKQLAEKVSFGFWEELDDDHTVVRFATSWATREEDIRELDRLLDTKF